MKYPILMVFDAGYAPYSIVLIKNITNNSIKSEELYFHLITDNETDFSSQEEY